MIEIVGFLEGKTPDHCGRILAMLLHQPDHRAEATHDYIQWLFPLDEPSRSVNGAPVLTELDINEIKESIKNNEDELIKQIKQNQVEQLKAGHHGVPLSVHKDKYFFGQDKFDDLVKSLQTSGDL